MAHRDMINVRTSDEIDTFLYTVEKAVNRAGLRFRGRRLSKEPVVNALIASFLQRKPEELVSVVEGGLKVYEQQLETNTDDTNDSS